MKPYHDGHSLRSANHHNILVKLAYVTILKQSSMKPSPHDKNRYDSPIHIAFSGIIVGTENKSRIFSVGDKVIGSNISAPHINVDTRNVSSLDYASLPWPNAEYVQLSESEIQKIPDEVTLREGPIVEYLAMCIHTLKELDINRSLKICIIGAGLLGSMMAQILANQGINTTIMSDNAIQTQSLWKYDVNTLQNTSRLKNFDLLINTTDVNTWPDVLIRHKQQKPQLVDIISQINPISVGQPSPNNKDAIILLTKPTQSNCDAASFHVTSGRINLSDYTNYVFQPNNNYPMSEQSRPAHNILIEIASDLALV